MNSNQLFAVITISLSIIYMIFATMVITSTTHEILYYIKLIETHLQNIKNDNNNNYIDMIKLINYKDFHASAYEYGV